MAKKPEVFRASLINFLKESIALVDTLKTTKELDSAETLQKVNKLLKKNKVGDKEVEAFEGIADYFGNSATTVKSFRKLYASIYTVLTGETI